MKRKLIKQGRDTLTVTLPKDWVSKRGLSYGDEIDMEEHKGGLLISAEKKLSKDRITIDIDDFNQALIWRFLQSIYRIGYDEVRIKFSNIDEVYDVEYTSLRILEKKIKMKTMEMIQDWTNRFVGMEIIDHGNNFCVIRDVGKGNEEEFDNALRRIFLLLDSMSKDSLIALKTGDKKISSSIKVVDTNIDRFTDFCLRILNKKGYKNFSKTPMMYNIITLLESLADEYMKLTLHILESKDIGDRFIKIHNGVNKLLSLFGELFYKFDTKKIIEMYELDKYLSQEMVRLLTKMNGQEAEIAHHIKKIGKLAIELMQLKIELEL